jgi:hypothetical protein
MVPSSQRFDILQALVNNSMSPSLVGTLFMSSDTKFKCYILYLLSLHPIDAII